MAALNLGSTDSAVLDLAAEPTKRRARFHTLAVGEVRQLTQDSVEVTFLVPEELQGEFDYDPGQHLALRATIGGRELRRSYSICRPHALGSVSVAIKRDLGGVFSSWANTELRAGARLDVMSPQGTFTTALDTLDDKHIVGIAAGSGITPLMSLAHTVLERSETSRFTLVYTNRTALDVMFLDELADLKDRYPARLALHHVLSRQSRSSALLSGRIDEEKLRLMLASIIRPAAVDEWFLCGPFELVQLCRDTLESVDVEPGHIRFELFTTGEPTHAAGDTGRPVVVEIGDKTFEIEFTLDGESATVTTPVNAKESILNAALRVRPDVPFACAGGVCGTCRAKLVSGDVTMTENYALEPDELARGYVLTCQSHPTTDRVVVDYDV
ncbi:phenylacetate-CoA oxygenase/reductase subunit PaaK [Cryobacterium sp. TMT2-18-3]|uniref:1,2-phenylacetyl-CoA epoxidase subunit PaaE n=1 Tax=unclassified Cryobacterium TaxID=2649013 RepID=UPI00106C8FA0|nr:MULTISPECIES: 1,2-phenylacetyl-CoA epoxidase subunit PaaE [unclassified Cryobacterium]TFC30350.1 phenylacetate-CoA oxygenase/reductase subunit PaaK [Cryobacterium sp. TMT2-18-2]TFC33098.1 phenylacetate-CoA oxygenase/reductase subunit PaaK [Cryobacterium sp. TMT2-42-4]TFC66809.1 phenylacetate-CoA oxygenase/reductase subunit PaaK [Cryobacterium sp. TMT2-18-3]